MTTTKELRWSVVCPFYVSLHDSEEAARWHADRIKGKRCKADHTVKLTDLPAGSRVRGRETP